MTIKSKRDEMTPELRAIADAAYEAALAGPPFGPEYPRVENPTREQVLERLAHLLGQLEGMEDWALRNGVQTSMFGRGLSGNA